MMAPAHMKYHILTQGSMQ